MSSRVANNLRLRRNFGRIKKIIDIPEPDRDPAALVRRVPAARRAAERRAGTWVCRAVFKSVFPIKDFNETASLEFVSYSLGEPKYAVEECHERGMTFAAPLKVTIQLVIWDVDPRDRRALDQEREGAGGLLRRDPADDAQRHVHGQRHRAGHRQPAAPLARASSSTTTRARRTPAASCSTRRASSRTAARGSTSSSTRGHPVRPHRPPPEVPRHRAAARPRDDHRGPAQLLLQEGHHPPRRPKRLAKVVQARSAGRQQGDARHPRRRANELIVKEGRKITKAAIKQMETAGVEGDPDRARGGHRPRRRRTTSSTRRPAKCCSSATRRSPPRSLERLRDARHQRRRGPVHRRHPHRPVAAQHAAAGQDRRRRKRRSSRSTGGCARAIRRRSRPRRRSSTTCSSTRSATTSRASAA